MDFWWVHIDSRTRPTCSFYGLLVFISILYALIPNVVFQSIYGLMRHIVKLKVLKSSACLLMIGLFVCEECFKFLLILSIVCNEWSMWLVWDLQEVDYAMLLLAGTSRSWHNLWDKHSYIKVGSDKHGFHCRSTSYSKTIWLYLGDSIKSY